VYLFSIINRKTVFRVNWLVNSVGSPSLASSNLLSTAPCHTEIPVKTDSSWWTKRTYFCWWT